MAEVLELLIDRIETPIGKMLIVSDREGNLRAADWTDHEGRMRRLLELHYSENGFRLNPTHHPNRSTSAIRRYFAGELDAIDGLPVETAGTPFQRQVWRALRKIRCGTTISYARLARRIGRPAAVVNRAIAVGRLAKLTPGHVLFPNQDGFAGPAFDDCRPGRGRGNTFAIAGQKRAQSYRGR